MRKVLSLVILLAFVLTGCASTKSLEGRVGTLEEKVSMVEEKQGDIEDRLGEDEARGSYYTNIETRSSVSGASGTISMSSKEIQTALRNAGYYYGAIDGKIGKQSMKAIKEFQADNGLKVDGIVGPQTRKALKPYLDQQVK